MKTEPYEKSSIRAPRLWKKAADQLGVHPAVLRKIYIQKWCVGITARDFIDLVCRPKDSTTYDKGFREHLERELAEFHMTDAEIAEEEAQNNKFAKEHDFCDLMEYRLKQLIQVGDEVVSPDDKTFLSGGQYQTKGKRYKIKNLYDDMKGLTGFTATTKCDVEGECDLYWSECGIISLWRDGKEIWNWHLAYYDLYAEQNPDDPDLAKLKAHCEEGAKKARIGER